MRNSYLPFFAVLGLFGLLISVGLFTAYFPEYSPKQIGLRHKAENVVREKLTDPESAQFSREVIDSTLSGIATVCGYVNAKNQFGGYVGRRRFIYQESDNSIFMEPTSPEETFEIIWRTCPPASRNSN